MAGPDGNPDIITANAPDFLLVGELSQYFEEIGVRTSHRAGQPAGISASARSSTDGHRSGPTVSGRRISEDFGPYAKGDWAQQSYLYQHRHRREPPDAAWSTSTHAVYPPQASGRGGSRPDGLVQNYVSIWPTQHPRQHLRALDYGMEQLASDNRSGRGVESPPVRFT